MCGRAHGEIQVCSLALAMQAGAAIIVALLVPAFTPALVAALSTVLAIATPVVLALCPLVWYIASPCFYAALWLARFPHLRPRELLRRADRFVRWLALLVDTPATPATPARRCLPLSAVLDWVAAANLGMVEVAFVGLRRLARL